MEIKDSGVRRKFDSGAVRDIAEGKGRCDLLPLGVIGRILEDNVLTLNEKIIITPIAKWTSRINERIGYVGKNNRKGN